MKAPPPVKVSEPDDRSTRPIPNIAPSRERLRPSNSLHTAQHLYATDVLSRPDNIRARKALRSLASDDRRIQLCNIEAMEQLRRTDKISAELVAPYAFQDIALHAAEIVAEGAAVNAGNRWFRLRYRCVVAPMAQAPSEFAFALGDAIPESEWSEHYLSAGSSIDE